jgi:Cdc6-like AAA superfamily ATPase
MTILVIDEIDSQISSCQSAIKTLLTLSTKPPNDDGSITGSLENYSSLFLLGIGNNITFGKTLQVTQHASFKKEVIFSAYSSEALRAILLNQTIGLFEEATNKILVSKVLHLKNGKSNSIYLSPMLIQEIYLSLCRGCSSAIQYQQRKPAIRGSRLASRTC